MSATVVEMPKSPELETRALSVVDEAKAVTIYDQESYDKAGAFITQRIKPLLAEADETFDPVIAAGHRAHQEALAAKAKICAPLKEARRVLDLTIGAFKHKQEEATRLEEARRLREEQDRLAAIREQEIEEAEKSGADPGLVQAMCEEPLPAPIIAPVPTYRNPAGISTRETWSAQVTSIRELCRAIADGKATEYYVQANMTALHARARADRGLMNVPGVKAISNTGVTARR